MYTHLQKRIFYEDIYDKHTVESGRRGMVHYEKFYAEFESKLDKDDSISRPGNAILLNAFYMQVIGLELLERYQNREQYINDWMEKDEAKDQQIASARLSEEPYCQHCNKQGLRIIDKSLMHRSENYKIGDPEEVLFVLRCPHCEKNSAFWGDGTTWDTKPTVCPKCKSELTHKTTRTKKTIIITYICTSCKHIFKDKMDIFTKEEVPDPNFDKDRVHFCLFDKDFREHIIATKKGFEDMAKLGREFKEIEENKELYDAVKEMRKPKIAELSEVLSPVLEKEGYIEFTLDKPDIGRDVYIGFSCLDSKPARADYESEKTLKKVIQETLKETNWRLMSDGISYRLGYLSGRLRAYEREEDLINLVNKRVKDSSFKPKPKELKRDDDSTMLAPDGTKIIF